MNARNDERPIPEEVWTEHYIAEKIAPHLKPLQDRGRDTSGLIPLKGFIVYNPRKREIAGEQYLFEDRDHQGGSHPYPRVGDPENHAFAPASTIKVVTVMLASRHMDAIVNQHALETYGKNDDKSLGKARKNVEDMILRSMMESSNPAAKQLGILIGKVVAEGRDIDPSLAYANYANFVLREECGVRNTCVVNADGWPHEPGVNSITILDVEGKPKWNMQQTTLYDATRIMQFAYEQINPEILTLMDRSMVKDERVRAEKEKDRIETKSKEFRMVAVGHNGRPEMVSEAGGAVRTPVFYKTGYIGNPIKFYNGAMVHEWEKAGEKLVTVAFLAGYHEVGSGEGKDNRARNWRETAAKELLRSDIALAVNTGFEAIRKQEVIAAIPDTMKDLRVRPAGVLDIIIPTFLLDVFKAKNHQSPDRK